MTASAPLDEVRSEPALFETILELAALEQRVVEKANQSGIGPMGFGGKTTLLGRKIGKINRLPASFFVSVAYISLHEQVFEESRQRLAALKA